MGLQNLTLFGSFQVYHISASGEHVGNKIKSWTLLFNPTLQYLRTIGMSSGGTTY